MARFTPVAVVKNGLSVRNGAVAIDAEHFAKQVVQRLGVRAVGVVAHGDVQLPVRSRAEVNRAAVVVAGGAEAVQFQKDTVWLPATATSPCAVNLLRRLCGGVPGTV